MKGSIPIAAAAALLCMPAEAARTHETNPFGSAEDLAEGKRMYRVNCGVCHGMEGKSGRGARLARKVHRRANTDAEMFDIIEKGVPGTDMPGVWLEEDDIWKILLFVRTFEKAADEPCLAAPGDAALGKDVFFNRASCAACHTVGMGGGRLGPDMSFAGAVFSREQLRAALVEPHRDVAGRYRTGRVETRAGEKHEGAVMAENGYSIFLMNQAEEILAFQKSELKSFTVSRESLMPSYADVLSAADMDHLLAYLCSLRGSGKGAPE